jgi:membrane-bound lytic murein transglycosylase D
MRNLSIALVLPFLVLLAPARHCSADERQLDTGVAEQTSEEAPDNSVETSSAAINRENEPADGTDDEVLAAADGKASDGGSLDPAYRDGLESAINKAETLYKNAVASYSNGNRARARQLYNEALRILSSANIDPQIQYQLSENFGNLFAKLKRILAGRSPTNCGGGSYSIPMDRDNELVQKYLQLYTKSCARGDIQKALERSGMYRAMIVKILREYDLPDELVYLPVIESFYNNDCLSGAGALGLWQLMPERARHLGLKVNYWVDERKDPEKATRAACRYLKELYQMFDDWHMALAAYNRGEYGLARDLRFSNATNIREIRERRAVPKETECFVPQYIACTLIGNNPAQYGLSESPAPVLSYDTVVVNTIIDLKIVANCTHATIGEIRRLNPALKAWCTPYSYPGFELHVPSGTRKIFLANIARIKDLNPFQGYIKYRVAKGDCLDLVARKFKTTSAEIRKVNNIKNPRQLKVNQVLVIRPGRCYAATTKG